MTESDEEAGRSYGCTFGCGNPYDYILIDVASGESQFLCLPCYIRLTGDMVKAVVEGENEDVKAWVALGAMAIGDFVPGPKGKPRGRNAPATSGDPDLFEAYDGRTMPEDLPEEFR